MLALIWVKRFYRLFQSTHSHGVRPGQRFTRLEVIRLSIHALTWSATKYLGTNCKTLALSIHALTWSATPEDVLILFKDDAFNPRTHMECDQRGYDYKWRAARFQSTHSHGVRLCLLFYIRIGANFQSTHSHGVRREVKRSLKAARLFQSTHSHGVRLVGLASSLQPCALSIHALTWSATIDSW